MRRKPCPAGPLCSICKGICRAQKNSIARAESRVVRAAVKWAKRTDVYSFAACEPLVKAVDAIERARSKKR